MAQKSNIEWTDSTVNFWWGCTKVGPGCDHCYAETWSKRTGDNIWGVGTSRRKIKGAVALLHKLDNGYSWWSADHEIAGYHQTSRRRVLIQSMSDLFDLEVPAEWFAEAWQTIERCARLHIQIVTKRISAVEKRLAAIGVTSWPQHAGLMITVCNQTEADRDIPRLLALKDKLGIPWVGLSMEPLLGPVNLTSISDGYMDGIPIVFDALKGASVTGHPHLDWIIVGGESGPGARPMNPDWARSLRDQCIAAEVPFFFKQWGEWVSALQVEGATAISAAPAASGRYAHPHRRRVHGGPLDGQCFEGLPENHHILRVGKKAAGRLLDGIEYNTIPRAFR
ncbi:MAG: phage Gp37/Gp68 family protein [Proteobacteria bacterium]|nr:phage Gp37/Gp68 family protein [Pseudomonadota bacterium]